MNILLWNTAYLGDVVLSTPVIRTLLDNLKDSRIAFVGRPFITEILKGYPIELIPYDKSLSASFQVLKRIKDFDIVISMHRSMRTAIILFLSRIPIRIGFDRSELSFLYTHLVEHRWEVHEVERNLELLKPLGVKNFIREPKLFVEHEERQKVKEKFQLPEEFVVISPFSNFPLKEWYTEGWGYVIKNLEVPCVIVGTKDQEEKARAFKGAINLVGKTSLRELLAVISLSKLVISCDSSPVHMANALGIDAISVYTSTSPKYGFYPLKGAYLVPEILCSPCSPNPKRCKKGTLECLSAVRPEDVVKVAMSYL